MLHSKITQKPPTIQKTLFMPNSKHGFVKDIAKTSSRANSTPNNIVLCHRNVRREQDI